jgi:glycerol-3-phosphate acyltransferase PlsY
MRRARRRRRSVMRTALWLGGAFAAGCIPTGPLVTRALTGQDLDELGDGKPGSANVGRSVGWGAGAGVLALDAAKAYVPATVARATGASDDLVAAMGIAGMAGHITVVGGRGAACALGAMFAMDGAVMGIGLVPLVGGTALHRHPQAVAVTAVSLPLLRWGLRRRLRPGLWALLLIGVLFGKRLVGTKGVPRPTSLRGWWRRLWLDRDD